MPDFYQLPAILLTALLLPVLAHLYVRFHRARTLLWLVGLLLALVRLVQQYPTPWWNFSDPALRPWSSALGLAAAQISAVCFLAALSPLGFRIGKTWIPYAIPFSIPLVAYAVLLHISFGGRQPGGLPFLLFLSLGALSLLVGAFWGYSKGSMPTWLGLSLCVIFGGVAMSLLVTAGGEWPLVFARCALNVVVILLLAYVYRHWSVGAVLTGLGLAASCLPLTGLMPSVAANPQLSLILGRISVLSYVVIAVGTVLLVLEDELMVTEDAQNRDRHARDELEAYTRLSLSRRRLEDFDRQANQLCQTIVTHSRFTQAGMLLLQNGQYRLAGAAGLDEATFNAFESLATRISPTDFLAPGTARPAVGNSQTFHLNMGPWLLPGDDLKRLGMTAALATPMYGRNATEGAIILASPRNPEVPIRAEDLLPIEVLTTRIQNARSQTMMLEKLIDAEKFAGLGQLANNVTRQLNNPLTVILGYASLLNEAPDIGQQNRRAVDAILNEARSMRQTMESLSRMSRTQNEHFAAISVSELLTDMEQLHRSEFVHRGIDFRLHIAPALPRVLGNSQQVRQAVLYCLQFAIETVENMDSADERTVRMDATSQGDYVQIKISHTGPGFLHPARAFEPFVPAEAAGETAGLGLSLCATILRENNGRISAVNSETRGAAIVLELQAA
jgi:signal transduction histidine kinase